MGKYLVELCYTHSQDDLDMLDVEANSHAEAEAEAIRLFRRTLQSLAERRDTVVTSVTAYERRNRHHTIYNDFEGASSD